MDETTSHEGTAVTQEDSPQPDISSESSHGGKVWKVVGMSIAAVLLLLLVVFAFMYEPRPDTVVEPSWGATRFISGQEVTISVDPTGGEGVFTIEERLSGATVTSYPANCGVNQAKAVLTCDYDEEAAGTIVYRTQGSGTVSGVIAGVDKGEGSSRVKEITGAAEISS